MTLYDQLCGKISSLPRNARLSITMYAERMQRVDELGKFVVRIRLEQPAETLRLDNIVDRIMAQLTPCEVGGSQENLPENACDASVEAPTEADVLRTFHTVLHREAPQRVDGSCALCTSIVSMRSQRTNMRIQCHRVAIDDLPGDIRLHDYSYLLIDLADATPTDVHRRERSIVQLYEVRVRR